MVLAEKSSHPSDISFSDCKDDFESLNFDFWNQDTVALMTFGKGSWNPKSTWVYKYPCKPAAWPQGSIRATHPLWSVVDLDLQLVQGGCQAIHIC